MLVQKFGGTSLEDSAALERACAIVRAASSSDRPVVVVSAMGDTTDRLVDALEQAASGEESRAISGLSRLKRDTESVVRDFFTDASSDVERAIEPLFAELTRMA